MNLSWFEKMILWVEFTDQDYEDYSEVMLRLGVQPSTKEEIAASLKAHRQSLQ